STPLPGAPAAPGSGVDAAPPARADGADEESGNADGMLAAGLLAGLGGGAAIGWLVSRWRRRGPDEATALAEVTGDPDGAATLAEITGRADDTATPAEPAPRAEPAAASR
ncbi:hypothetical protein EAD98_26205, partial [Micromonospora sp. CV4]